MIIGIGLNVENEKPSVSLSQLAKDAGIDSTYLTREIVLAEFLSKFQGLVSSFVQVTKSPLLIHRYIYMCRNTNRTVCLATDQAGFAPLRESYESMWMHSGQKVQAADNNITDESGQPATSMLTIQVLVYISNLVSLFHVSQPPITLEYCTGNNGFGLPPCSG